MNATSTVSVRVEGDGDGVVAQSGCTLWAGSPTGWDWVMPCRRRSPPRRDVIIDRGRVLTHTMLMLAGGGECCGDIEALRVQEALFGRVPSDSTVHRTFRRIDEATLAGCWSAMADVRAQVWSRSAATTGTDTVILDIDASLVEVHSENKAGTAATYKGGFGFHPMFCFADATGEALGAILRPGNTADTLKISTSCFQVQTFSTTSRRLRHLPSDEALPGRGLGPGRPFGRHPRSPLTPDPLGLIVQLVRLAAVVRCNKERGHDGLGELS